MLTVEYLRKISPTANGEIIGNIVKHQDLLAKYGIVSAIHIAYFLGQCACETRGFTSLEESLYYTTTKRLRAVWPSRFKSDAAAAPFLRNPEKLANSVYGGRLGNDAPGDGWKYRGSGMKQITGKYNFSVVAKMTGLDCIDNPELLRTFPAALEAACIYWKVNGLAKYADAANIVALTKAIQGGDGGLADRRIYTDRALAGVPSLAPGDGFLVKYRSQGSDVVTVQKMLAALGMYGGKIDGDFGGGTLEAVREFQESRNLRVDGVVGRQTIAALIAAQTEGIENEESS